MLSVDRLGAQLMGGLMKNSCDASLIENVFNRPHKYLVRHAFCHEPSEETDRAPSPSSDSAGEPQTHTLYNYNRSGLGVHIGEDVVVIEYEDKDEMKLEQIKLTDIIGVRYLADAEAAPPYIRGLKSQERPFRRSLFRPNKANQQSNPFLSVGVILIYVYSQDPTAQRSRGYRDYLLRRRVIYEVRFTPTKINNPNTSEFASYITQLRIAADAFATEILRRISSPELEQSKRSSTSSDGSTPSLDSGPFQPSQNEPVRRRLSRGSSLSSFTSCTSATARLAVPASGCSKDGAGPNISHLLERTPSTASSKESPISQSKLRTKDRSQSHVPHLKLRLAGEETHRHSASNLSQESAFNLEKCKEGGSKGGQLLPGHSASLVGIATSTESTQAATIANSAESKSSSKTSLASARESISVSLALSPSLGTQGSGPSSLTESQEQEQSGQSSVATSDVQAANVSEHTHTHSFTSTTSSVALRPHPERKGNPRFGQKPLLIYLNPHSGSKRARTLFKHNIAPALAEGDVRYELVITTHANHATEHVQAADLSKYSGIIIVSGDGLMHEVINGLMARSDWRTAAIPLGILPAGSSNALAASINYAAGEPWEEDVQLTHSLYILLRHVIQPLDLLEVDTPQRHRYAFLQFSWGFFADVDIESERLRALGSLRFPLYAADRIIRKRMYRGRFTFLPVESYEGNCMATSQLPEDLSKCFYKPSVAGASGSNDENEIAQSRKESGDKGAQAEHLGRFLPPLDEQIRVENGWTVIEDTFFCITFLLHSHLDTSALMFPELEHHDPSGSMCVFLARSHVPRTKLLNFFMNSLQHGALMGQGAEIFRVRAFRLEPLGRVNKSVGAVTEAAPGSGIFSLDGESIEYGPIQAEVIPGALSLMARPPARAHSRAHAHAHSGQSAPLGTSEQPVL